MSQQTPIAKFKAGQVSAALWENEIEAGGRPATILKATIQRRYKDTDGRWKSSTSFSRNEIPLAVHCLQKAFDKMIDLQNQESAKGGQELAP
jgi:hypothetical protein